MSKEIPTHVEIEFFEPGESGVLRWQAKATRKGLVLHNYGTAPEDSLTIRQAIEQHAKASFSYAFKTGDYSKGEG